MANFLTKLKQKWNIESNYDLVMIMLVFSLAGSGISFWRKPIFHMIGITHDTPLWIKVAVYIPLIMPLYQLNLIIFGFLLGQFKFFWNKEKQLGRFLRQSFRRVLGLDSPR